MSQEAANAQPSTEQSTVPANNESKSPPWGTSTKAIAASIAIILAAILVWRFSNLIPPIVIAIILAYILNPLINFVDRRTLLDRGATVLLIYLILLLLVGGGMVAVGFLAVDQANQLAQVLPDQWEAALKTIQDTAELWLGSTIFIGPYAIEVRPLLNIVDLSSLVQQAVGLIQSTFSVSGLFVAQFAQATISALGLFFLAIVLSIYIARDMPRFTELVSELAQQPGYRADAERIMADFARIWDAYLRGQVILGLVIGVVVSVALMILGVNNALGLGVLSGIMEFLPVVGPIIGAGAAVLVAFFQDKNYFGLDPFYFGLLVLGVMFLIQQIENNLLVPRIVGGALNLHPLEVMISVLMGASLAGILGAILAAPVLATVKLLGAYAWRKMLDLPPFADEEPPVETVDSPLTKARRRRRRRKKG
ncbi:MAG: AI-2E family transporter [Caldilineaceae bacterium]